MKRNQAIRKNYAGDICLIETRNGSPVPNGELKCWSEDSVVVADDECIDTQVRTLAVITADGRIETFVPLPFSVIEELYRKHSV